MAAVEIKTEGFVAALSDLDAGIHNGAHQAVSAAADAALDHAKQTTLFKDGPEAKLRKSIHKESPKALEARVVAGGADAPYAKFVENGTRAHEIHAKGGGSLRFVVNGEVMFRRVVHHPGTAERPFMAEAAKIGEQTLDYGIDIMLERPIAKFNAG